MKGKVMANEYENSVDIYAWLYRIHRLTRAAYKLLSEKERAVLRTECALELGVNAEESERRMDKTIEVLHAIGIPLRSDGLPSIFEPYSAEMVIDDENCE